LIIGIMPDTATIPPVAPAPSLVNQVASNSTINIYPNPATEVINVNLQGTVASQVRITDLQGRTLTSITPAITTTIVTIPVNELSEGMYLVQVQTAQGIVTKKIVVAR
jgi:hypothetical protein